VSAADRLDGVDLRIGVPDVKAEHVVAAFALDTCEASERAVYLLENLSAASDQLAAVGATAWLVRAPRQHELVVHLRPVPRARLSPDWAGFHSDSGHRLRIAEEWATTPRILTASLTAFLDAADPGPAPSREPVALGPGRGRLSARQRDFLADCAEMVVQEDRLALLGPIRERTWMLRRNDLRFLIRRWTARGPGETPRLDLVDLEADTSAMDAPFLFPALRSLARQHEADPEMDVDPIAIRAVAWASAHWRRLRRNEGLP
jgi:hypothetical protein